MPEHIFIPDSYINDIDIKISLYKRIALINSSRKKEELMIEMIDRFGSIPLEVENLFKLIDIRILCYKRNIEQIEFGKKGILFAFFQDKPPNPKKIIKLNMDFINSKIKIRPDNKIFYNIEGALEENDNFNLVKKIIDRIT